MTAFVLIAVLWFGNEPIEQPFGEKGGQCVREEAGGCCDAAEPEGGQAPAGGIIWGECVKTAQACNGCLPMAARGMFAVTMTLLAVLYYVVWQRTGRFPGFRCPFFASVGVVLVLAGWILQHLTTLDIGVAILECCECYWVGRSLVQLSIRAALVLWSNAASGLSADSIDAA